MAQIPMSQQTLDAYQQHDVIEADHPSSMALIHDSLFEGEVLDGLFRGEGTGVRMLGVTNKRLIMVENVSRDAPALTSVPLSRVTMASFVPGPGQRLDSAVTVAIKVMMVVFELTCRDHDDARAAHDLLVWSLICL